MKHLFSKTLSLGLAAAMLITSCSKDNGGEPEPVDPAAEHRYVVVTMSNNDLTKPGYIRAFDAMPSGNVSTISTTSLQGTGMGGWRPYSNWIFKMFNSSGNEKGIERINIGADNKVSVGGFIKTNNVINGSGNFVIENATSGYYFNADAPLEVQTFNPTTLSRTGSIDVSAVAKTDVAIKFQGVGQHFLAVKGGKLYADITYGKNASPTSGMFDDYFPDIYVAVIDIATKKYEKTITYANTGNIAYINDNPMFSFDEKGDLYIVTQGRTAIGGKSKIIRINAAATDFDKTWEIDMDGIMTGGKFVGVYAQNGKIVTLIPSVALTGGPTGNINFAEIWEYYTIDIATKTRTKITGVPRVTNPGAAFAVTKIDDQLLLRVNAPSASINGYYALNSGLTAATSVFNVTEGGSVSGIYKVKIN